MEIFPQTRQVAVFRLGVPSGRALRQFQLGTPAPRFTLLAREPIAQRRHEIVVRELIIPLSARGARRCGLLVGDPLGIGGSDEANLAIENPDQLFEIAGRAP